MATENERDAAIKGLKAYQAKLQADIDRMTNDLESVARSIELLSGQPREVIVLPSLTSGGYAGLKPMQAAERLLREEPTKWFKASVAVHELRKRGFRARTDKNMGPLVTGALKRLHAKGIADQEERSGAWSYRLTQESGLAKPESGQA